MRALVGKVGEMGRAIDHTAPYPLLVGGGMATKVTEIATTNPPQQIEIDRHARGFGQLIFRVSYA